MGSILSEDEYLRLDSYNAVDFTQVGMGAEGVIEVIKSIELAKLAADLREELSTATGQRHIKATKRLKVVDGLRRAGVDPLWMVMKDSSSNSARSKTHGSVVGWKICNLRLK